MKSSVPLRVGFFAAGVVAAFFAGKFARPDFSGGQSSTVDPVEAARVSAPVLSPDATLHLADPGVSAAAFSTALLRIRTAEEFKEVFDEMLPNYESSRSHDALLVLADAWAAIDPVGAAESLNGLAFNDPRNPYLFSALGQWASNDPQATLVWVESHHADSGETREYLLAGVIRGVAGKDPDLALKLVLELPEGPTQLGAVEFVTRTWLGEGFEPAVAGFAKIPASENRLRERVLGQLVAHASLDEFDAVKAWAAALPSDSDRRIATAATAARWSRSDPESAAKWVDEVGDPAARAQAYGEIGSRWARADPLAAGDWLAQHAKQPEYDFAARGVAWSTVGIDPDKAFAQVAGITTAPLRDETFEQVARVWMSHQPQAAKRYFEGESPIPAAMRARLLESFE